MSVPVSQATRRVHYASGPVVLDRSRKYLESARGFKPDGLWYSVESGNEDDWASWCRGEDYNLEGLRFAHNVEIDFSSILVIETPEALLDFDRQFRASEVPGSLRFDQINWGEVVALYDGIEIAPYQWGLQLDSRVTWYYPWDCASGVVWNLACVRSFEAAP